MTNFTNLACSLVLGLFWIAGPGLGAQLDFSSQLPVLVIDTEGRDIVDEPKITARLKVIDNPGGGNRPGAGAAGYDGFIGIEKRGSTSQTLFPKVGFGFETRTPDGEDQDVSLVGLPREEDWVLHGPYSDKSLIRNALTYRLGEQLMPFAPRTRLVELIINDDYRGVYLLTERIKRDKHRVDIAKLTEEDNEGDQLTGGYILKLDKTTASPQNIQLAHESAYRADTDDEQRITFQYHVPGPEDITEAQKEYIGGHLDDFEDALFSPDFLDPVAGYRPYVDLQSFVDFFIVNELARNVDAYRISTYFYKEKDSDGGRIHMGPVWDFNLGFGNANYCDGSKTEGWSYAFNEVCDEDDFQPPRWWARLWEDPAFRDLLRERWVTLRRGRFAAENLNRQIDSLVAVLGPAAVDRNFQRWPVLDRYVWPNNVVRQSHSEEIAYLKNWIRARALWMDGALEQTTLISDDGDIPLQFSPNPTTGKIIYRLQEDQVLSQLRVYNQIGQTEALYRVPNGEIDLSHLSSGLYFLEGIGVDGRRRLGRVVIR